MTLKLEEKALIKKGIYSLALVISIIIVGSLGYMTVTKATFLDSMYMTVITVTTIGFGEVIDTSKNELARIWTMVVALGGVSMITYLITNLAAILIDGNFTRILQNRIMEYNIKKQQDHYLICGMGRVGYQIIKELIEEGQPFVCADLSESKILELKSKIQKNFLYQIGDCTEEETLIKMGVLSAKGVFVATDDDNANLVICLAAKQLAPNAKIITLVKEPRHTNKFYAAGADKVICPFFMAGLRMTTEMVRPDTIDFVDTLVRVQKEKANLKEVEASSSFMLSELPESILVLGIERKNQFEIRPPKLTVVQPGDRLFVLCKEQEIKEMENFLVL